MGQVGITVSTSNFADYAEGDNSIWDKVAGSAISHRQYGLGKITRIDQRPDYMPLIHARFDDFSEVFNPKSFKCDMLSTLDIPSELASSFFAWEKEKALKEGDPWKLAEECANLRKSNQSEKVIKLITEALKNHQYDRQAQAALLTTCGGAFRDIGNLEQAEKCARKAIRLNPKKYYAYNLLGAIYYQRGEPAEGYEFVKQALERGANKKSQEVKILEALENAGEDEKRKVAEYLHYKNPKLLEGFSESGYHQIIKQGENDKVEFKSSLRWDCRKQEVNKALEHDIAKAICAFLNTDGGTLFIGVDDDGDILGIENDCKTLGRKQSKDEFQRKVTELINNYLGKEFHEYITIRIKNIKNKEICVVKVSRSNLEAYLNNHGEEEFYIRAGTSSQKLSMSQANKYVTSHWDKNRAPPKT